jgi:competence protein ComEA
MKKFIPVLLISGTFLFSVSPLVIAESVTEKTKMMQMKMQKINVNTATLDELSTLPGVGAKKAEAIIAYRENVGRFTTLEQLAEVKGIGNKMLEKMKDRVSL